MARPLVRFVYHLPPWVLIGSALFFAALIGALIVGTVALVLGLRWKRRKLNEESGGAVEALEMQLITLEKENREQADLIRRYQAAIRGARASLDYSGFIGENHGEIDHGIDS